MKQKPKPIKKTITQTKPKRPTQLAIEMDVKGIGFFLFLGLAAALIVFYLGYTFGQATRDPNAVAQQAQVQGDEAGETSAADVQKELKIFDIRGDSGSGIEDLKKDSNQAMDNVNKLISETRSEQKRNQVDPVPPPVKNTPEVVRKETDFTPKWPDSSEKTKTGDDLHTYQIITTKDIQKANSIVRQLKRKGFDAYMVDIDLQGTRLYRVRVGRGTRAELQAIEEKLNKVIAGVGKPRLMKYGN
ncbi:MAG: SPOR domain-containing protein [bacterium]